MVIEGKTKRIESMTVAIVTAKDDITAGNGARHDVLEGKAELATRTTSNIFELLRRHDIPLAYIGRGSARTFYSQLCQMIPVEVVVRYVAAGSYCKRNPEVASGTLLDKPIVEFYLKTTNKRYQQFELSVDDPLLHPVQGDGWHIFNPNLPLDQGDLGRAPLSEKEQTKLTCRLNTCHTLALEVGDILRVAWEQQSGLLQDFKVEFGVLSGERIVLADVIDADSWRVKRNGAQLSKQGYRDGDSLEEVLKIYQLIAGLTDAMLR